MAEKHVSLNIDGEVATLVLNRPPGNILDIATLEELNGTLFGLRDEAALKVLVIRGANGLFCEGMDLTEHTRDRVQRLLQVFVRFFETLRMVQAVTVAAVEGHALGAGFELAMGCNLFVATETATFALPQTRMGLLPPVAAAILPRIAPRRRAMEWILTGNKISARRLEHDGVINRLLPEDHFDSMLAEFVKELTGKSAPVLQLARRAQLEAYYGTFPDALTNIHSLYIRDLIELEDAQEGPRAAVEGRKPEWKNR